MAGVKQSGLPSFIYANVIDDFKIFECARDDAAFMLSHPEREDFYSLIEAAKKDAKGASLA